MFLLHGIAVVRQFADAAKESITTQKYKGSGMR